MKFAVRTGAGKALICALAVAMPHVAFAADGYPVPEALPAPTDGMGQIVFWRPGALMGAAMGCGVNLGSERISALGKGKYFLLNLAPGAYEFNAKSEAKDVLNLEVEPGEVLYVKCTIRMGMMAGRPNLAPSTAAEFASKKAGLKYVDSDDHGSRVVPDPGKAGATKSTPAFEAGGAAASSVPVS